MCWNSFISFSGFGGSARRAMVESRARLAMQDWRSVPLFLSRDVWSKIHAKEQQMYRVLQSLMQHLVQIGLRCPSEPTQQMIAASDVPQIPTECFRRHRFPAQHLSPCQDPAEQQYESCTAGANLFSRWRVPDSLAGRCFACISGTLSGCLWRSGRTL